MGSLSKATCILRPPTSEWPLGAFATTLLFLCVFVRPSFGIDLAESQLKGMSLDELMQVEVTSVSGYAEKLADAPSAIQVISSASIDRSTAVTLADAMRLANNLDVAQKNPHDWAISARGFNANVGNKLLVLIDGRSVYTPLFAGVFWNAQDYILEDIDQIEVISGPGGTLWGANAVNGVININTKDARDTQGLLFNIGLGTETRELVAMRYGGKIAPAIYYRVYAKFLSIDDGVLTGGSSASNAWAQGQAGFRIDVNQSPTDTFTVHGDMYSGNLDIQTGGTARIAGGNLVGQWQRKMTDGSGTLVQFYVDRTHLAVPFAATSFAPFGYLKDDLDNYDLKIQNSSSLGQFNRLSLGFEYRYTHDKVQQQAPNVAYLPAKRDQSLPSLFFQDEIALRDDLSFYLGTKIEHNSYTGFEYEPSARLQWRFAQNQMAWAAVSRAVRMPSRFDRDLYEPAPPLSVIAGGPRFASETVIAYETGYRAKITSNLTGSLSFFYNDYDNLRSWGTTPTTVLPIVFENNLEAKSYGLELNVDLQVLPWWHLNAGYDLLREHVRVKPGHFDLQNALDETADPAHQFALRSAMDLPKHIAVDSAFRWVDALHNNNGGVPGTVPPYAELDIRIAWSPVPQWEFALTGKNLLHAHHAEYGTSGADRQELQRSVMVKTILRY
jgi:iron complex outermembrane receptor protein